MMWPISSGPVFKPFSQHIPSKIFELLPNIYVLVNLTQYYTGFIYEVLMKLILYLTLKSNKYNANIVFPHTKGLSGLASIWYH